MGFKDILPTLDATLLKVSSLEIPKDRKLLLEPLIEYLRNKKEDKIQLNFICTHNSRRSQFGQVWGQVAAYYYGYDVECFSGGTEETAFHPNAIAALSRQGFAISSGGEENPRYTIMYSNKGILECYSKVYDSEANPSKDFAAIMTCSHADESCPIIQGADVKVSLKYEDPKKFDGTELEGEMYDERSLQIASEMFYVFESASKG